MPLQIIRQDITKMQVDAIVNTTNAEMVGYRGVDYAVHQGAGPELDAECERIAPLGLGTAKITKGYNLDAKYIIHTSGPIWQGGLVGESIILKSCYLESLKLAVKYGCDSVAFPLISAGTYGYPKDQVLKFAIQVITEFLFDHELMVYLCVFDRKSYEFSQKLFAEISEFIDDDYVEESEDDFLEEYTGYRGSWRYSIAEDEFSKESDMCDSTKKISLPINACESSACYSIDVDECEDTDIPEILKYAPGAVNASSKKSSSLSST